MKSENIASHR